MTGRYASLYLLSRFQAELDRLLQEAMGLPESEVEVGEWQPAVDIVETDASILILVELPGFSAPHGGIDDVLVRGAETSRFEVWPEERRRQNGVVLSDHAPVELTIL